MDQVCAERTPLVITRKNAAPVVLMSLRDYHQIDQTAYLLHSPANARRLREAIAELAGDGGSESGSAFGNARAVRAPAAVRVQSCGEVGQAP